MTATDGVKCWGYNYYGALGDGTTMDRTRPVDVCASGSGAGCTVLTGVAAIPAPGLHTCALMTATDGVKCWGYNFHGELGDGTTTNRSNPEDVCASGAGPGCTVLTGVAAISAGTHQTCALMDTGDTKCWGWNIYGQLGNGTTTDASTPAGVIALTGSGLPGDIDGDCDVDALDGQETAYRFLTTTASPLYSHPTYGPVFDRQGGADGDIDMQDVQYVLGRYLSTCAVPAPSEPAPSTQSSSISVTPASEPVTPGETVNVTISLDTPLTDVSALDVSLDFDESMFELFDPYFNPSVITYGTSVEDLRNSPSNAGICYAQGAFTRVGCFRWGTTIGPNTSVGLSGDLVTLTLTAKQTGTAVFTPAVVASDAWGQQVFSAGTLKPLGPLNIDPTGTGHSWTFSMNGGVNGQCTFAMQQLAATLSTYSGSCTMLSNFVGGGGVIDTDTGTFRFAVSFGTEFPFTNYFFNGTASGGGGGGSEAGTAGGETMMAGTWENDASQSGTFSAVEVGLGYPGDGDEDGCPDEKENGAMATAGGQRDRDNPNDYFNPSHDGQNRVDDILLVVAQYFKDDNDENPGLPLYEPLYNPDTDRTMVGPNAWNLGPPNGLQRVDDILNAVKQYYHDCA